ncbi:glycosyltransferase [Yeosuana sp. MJ-SS3]|uniref:Glycosyltransferase n=1 Tax=Gilvirhabdus luticola TaxID=3079858 RepID=A0ABU3U4N1_9FLAO|nr:glycosyltransferase [Yeosuana sp. MJ-SS3]MDU8885370.1 glycosyltransferase [Yeosuana sp. MJ-SS3]
MPFFSVITPLYNKEDYIEATIKSVLNQTFDDFEIVIVDDGSTDNSLKILSQIKSSKINILVQENQGPSVARNKAIANAKGKYIAPLDADDIWREDHLVELKSLIDSFPNAGVFCNNYKVKLNKNLTRNAHFNFDFATSHLIIPDFFDANIYNYIASSSSTAFLKSSFIELGGYNTSLRTGQDLDLWIRFALKYEIAFNPKATMIYNNYDDLSLSKSELNETRYNFISSYKKEEEKNPSLKKYLDVNRFALVLRCKMNNENELYKKVQTEINYKNLNLKQKILINSPKFILHFLKKIQRVLIKNKMYLTAYN